MLGCLAGCGSSNSNSVSSAGCTTCSTNGTKYVAVADGNGRVLIFDESLGTGESASYVLGSSTFTQLGSGIGQSGMNMEAGLAFDSSGNLYVADLGNNRVLQFAPPFSNGMNASVVFGQSNFTTYSSSSTASGFTHPVGVASDASGNLWVADGSNNSRVLEFKTPFTSGMSATVAIGQTSTSTTQGCNKGGVGSSVGSVNPTAGTLCGASAMAFDSSGNLWIADSGNNRILEYAAPFSNGMAATLELGHAAGANAFSTYMANDGGSVAGGTFWNPTGLAFDAHGDLWVADNGNNRVLEFVPPFSNGMAATVAVGQPDLTHNSHQSASLSSLSQPPDVAFDSSGNLLVTDSSNARVMVFAPTFTSGMNASMVLGQQNYTSTSCSLAANSICVPGGVATY
jgi:sugar lactone lactonase YvrE